ncbi:MAG: helix-turn-helix domain-containing protein [Alphaproteobacteria bacterium]|nr:helix-turn-helix domain-containing protein [Alphaproteobacteria bacterium]
MADVVVRVRERRGALGLSQADLAGRIGISRQALAAVESGRSVPSTTVALGLARALGCAVEDLFGLLPDVMRPVQVAPADRVVLGCVDGRWVAHPAPADRPADGRVRPDGTELLADPEVLSERVLLAGCAPLLGLLEASWLPTTSTAALQLLARGEVHVAGLHLASDAEGHAELARSAVEAPVVVNVTRWQQGLVLAAGNPLGIRSAEDLRRPGLRVAHRPAGAGAQRVLERAFAGAPVPPGPVAADHEEVARMVRWGVVDVGVAIEPVALAHGLPFLPLAEERFDLVVPGARLADPRIARLLERLSGLRFRADASGLPGYDLALVGQTFGGAAC